MFLQEHSQLPGFPPEQSEVRDSLAATEQLARSACAHGARVVVVLQTAARLDGDAVNRWRFPDYPTMRAHLDAGFVAMAQRAATSGAPVRIAPAGATFAIVHDEARTHGDPTARGSLFASLYESDDRYHPSALGTYVMACAAIGVVTGGDVGALPTPRDLDPTSATILRDAVRRALAGLDARGVLTLAPSPTTTAPRVPDVPAASEERPRLEPRLDLRAVAGAACACPFVLFVLAGAAILGWRLRSRLRMG